MPKRRIAIFQEDLSLGGIQKSLINLLNSLDYSKCEVDLYLMKPDNFFGDSLPDYVNMRELKSLPAITKLLPFSLVKKLYSNYLKTLDTNYDVSIDFNGYQPTTALGALSVAAKSRVVWVHSNYPARAKIDTKFKVLLSLHVSKFGLFDNIVVVTRGLVDIMTRLTGVPTDKTRVIGNLIDVDEIFAKADQAVDLAIDESKLNIVAVSRLVHIKGVDVLIGVIDRVLQYRDDVHLYVVGGGPERAHLEAQVVESRLSDHVTFLGPQPNPYAYMNLMDVFVSTSRYEGQGMSTLEAKSLGLRIFIPKHLEEFSYGVTGSDDLVSDIVSSVKAGKSRDELGEYNKRSKLALAELIGYCDD